MVKTHNLSYQYTPQQEVFQFPDIDLNNEENLLVLGKSGIGKTTLLHLMAGLLKPKTGSVCIQNNELQTMSAKKRDLFIGKNIGMVFQKNYAIRSLNVIENLRARLFFARKKVDHDSLTTLLKQLDLLDQQYKKVNQLSEGQLQRLGIGLSVIHKPKVILADEPTSSLDNYNCKAVLDLLLKQTERQKANLIVITHDQRVKPVFKNVITL